MLRRAVGIDADTFAGAPAVLTQGRIEDLRLPDTVIVDEWGAALMGRMGVGPDGKPRSAPLKVGDTFEINDIQARIVGICKVRRAFTGGPFVYTTYDRAKGYTLGARRTLSFMLVEPQPGVPPAELCGRIERATGLKAWTSDTVIWDWGERSLARNTFWWFWTNTGIPFSFGTAVLLGLFVGIAISGQTFYSFVLENLRYFAAIKAMGAGMGVIARMLLVQACTAGLIGFGLGAGMAQHEFQLLAAEARVDRHEARAEPGDREEIEDPFGEARHQDADPLAGLASITSGDETILESGLSVDEVVVTDGHLRLLPGSRVSVKGGNTPQARP